MAVDTRQRLRGRREARFHVQVEIAGTRSGTRSDEVVVEGRVVRAFRGEAQLRVGDRVEFVVPVFRPGELVAPGKTHVSFDRLASAAYVEAYLDGAPPRCEIRLDEFTLIPAPVNEPVLTTDELERLLAGGSSTRRWWQLWRRDDA